MKHKDSPNSQKGGRYKLVYLISSILSPGAASPTWFSCLLHTAEVRNGLVKKESWCKEECAAHSAQSPFPESILFLPVVDFFFPFKRSSYQDCEHKDPDLDFSPFHCYRRRQKSWSTALLSASRSCCCWSFMCLLHPHRLKAETKSFHAAAGRRAGIQRVVALSPPRPPLLPLWFLFFPLDVTELPRKATSCGY